MVRTCAACWQGQIAISAFPFVLPALHQVVRPCSAEASKQQAGDAEEQAAAAWQADWSGLHSVGLQE